MTKSSQKFIARNRAPRVRIDYDVELFGAEKAVELPFVIGVMAGLSGSLNTALPPIADRRFLEFDIDNFENRLLDCAPRVTYCVPDMLTGEGELDIDLAFKSMDDFGPGAVAANIEPLSSFLQTRRLIASLLSYIEGRPPAEVLLAEIIGDLPLQQQLAAGTLDHEFVERIERMFQPKSESAMNVVEAAISSLAAQVLRNPQFVNPDVARTLQSIIAATDAKLTGQVNVILHHPDFQELEGRWRGLHYLVSNTETDELLKIRVLDISQDELGKTLRKYRGTAWDQSPIFKKLYEEEFGQFGGEPYACLIGDYFFDHGAPDVEGLGSLAQIAAAAHAPFIAGASPSIMQLGSWQEISIPRDISAIFTTHEYAPWQALRESEDSKYVALTMPRVLGRVPYGTSTEAVDAFDFDESIEVGNPNSYVWFNSAYTAAVCIARAFKQYGWAARIRGMESGGQVEVLPVHIFPAEDGRMDAASPTEIAISDRWEAELARSGLMPLVHRKNSEFAAFIGAKTLHQPAEYDDPDITANAALAAQLPYLLPCCRFAHYMKCIARDTVGAHLDREKLQSLLNHWISQYVEPDPAHSSESAKVTRPLADAEVVLEEVEGSAGYYKAKLFIRPYYQLEGLTVSSRFIVLIEHAA